MTNDYASAEPIATSEEFKAALLATRDWMGISPTQLQMLQTQCRAQESTITAAQIKEQLGFKSVAAARTAMFATMTQAHIDFMLSKIPMGRFLEVDEAAAMVAWLASEECSFTTGSVFDLSGGRATY